MSIPRTVAQIVYFVMASTAPGYWLNPGWFLFTAFVGLNLFQSAFHQLVSDDYHSAETRGSILRQPDEGWRLRAVWRLAEKPGDEAGVSRIWTL